MPAIKALEELDHTRENALQNRQLEPTAGNAHETGSKR